jgi:hypothetical protein
MKLVLAVPTYGGVEPIASRHLRAALLYAAYNGVEWVADASPDRTPHAGARNQIVMESLTSEADGIFWCDSDIILPRETIARLASYKKDFVSGVYFQRDPPHSPLYGMRVGSGFAWAVDPQVDDPIIAPCDGIGFGCCITSTKMLRAMLTSKWAKEWNEQLFQYGEFSEDLTFCNRAAQCGFRPHVDTGILCGHLGKPQVITYETYKPYIQRLKDAGKVVRLGGREESGLTIMQPREKVGA